MTRSRLLLLAAIVGAIAAFVLFDLGRYLDFDYLKAQQEDLQAWVRARPLEAAILFFVGYVVVTALSLPGATVMTLAGGAVFGLVEGILLVSFASTLGATLAFLSARFLLRDGVRRRFGQRLAAVDEGIAREGAFYLFTLRLVPLFPFFLVNLAMGLTALRVATYWWVSQLGMLPGTFVYVNAGTQLARIGSPGDVFSPNLLLAFALLGLLPLVAKKSVDLLQSRKALAHYPRPKRFDRNLIVIGGGSAGLVAAYIAAAVKAKVTLIEKHKLGGDCLNTGCVPSKALLRTARFAHDARRASELGVRRADIEIDFAEAMQRVQRVIAAIEPHDSAERYTGLGVEVISGEARVISPYAVEVDGKTLTTRAIVVAAGATPTVPAIEGLAEAGFLTSDTIWNLRERPDRLVVLGGGPIGCELAQAFARLGCRVIQLQRSGRLLPREDPEISTRLLERFRAEGIDVRLHHAVVRVRAEGSTKVVICEAEGETIEIQGDEILVAVGRTANTHGYGLEELGVRVEKRGTLAVDGFLRTNIPTIFACGDVAGPYQFTHTASHQAWYAAVNALFGNPLKRFRVDYSVIPWSTFTDPEIARVGLNEMEAEAQGIAFETTTYNIADLDRAIADSDANGVVKVLTVPGKDKILGVTIVGTHAGDLLAEFVLAMRWGLGLNKILSTIHIYPTLAEANKQAAGAWRRNHVSPRVLHWLDRFHRWRRTGVKSVG